MTQFNDTELTAAVIQSFENTPDPRAKFLLQELVKSLHEYVRKTDLTFAEWEYAIDFLTRTGQKCTDTRQEFILLSDVLGVSMLVDAVNHREREGATQTTVLGPFYVGEHKVTAHGTDISPNNQTGERMFVQSRVSDLKGKPLANVPVDVWHADDDGFYDSQKPNYDEVGASARARFITDRDGRFFFRTFLPRHRAVRLSAPDRRPGRRDDRADQPPPDAPGACALPGQCQGVRAADHPCFHGRRQIPGFRRGVRREGRPGRQGRAAQRCGDARRH